MTKYREIICLTSLGFSQRDIMQAVVLLKKLSAKVQKRAREISLVQRRLEWKLWSLRGMIG
ncbi:MAG: hypothetical protein ACI4S2_13120 [Lachnospiraceae bacterium]